MSDPRVYFAGERTLLAWIRTGLTVMGFGFVVARFGLFLRLMAAQQVSPGEGTALHSSFSSFVGIGLVVFGAMAILASAYQFRQFTSSIPAQDLPTSYNRSLPVMLAVMLGLLGLALAVYLAG